MSATNSKNPPPPRLVFRETTTRFAVARGDRHIGHVNVTTLEGNVHVVAKTTCNCEDGRCERCNFDCVEAAKWWLADHAEWCPTFANDPDYQGKITDVGFKGDIAEAHES